MSRKTKNASSHPLYGSFYKAQSRFPNSKENLDSYLYRAEQDLAETIQCLGRSKPRSSRLLAKSSFFISINPNLNQREALVESEL
jgi:hypothetical protein